MELTFSENLMKSVIKYNIPINSSMCHKLVKFKDLMLEYNKSHNITAITEENDIIFKHFIDSLLCINEIRDNTDVLDIGCGGGFPSVPLSIAKENVKFIAMDSVGKKTEFVKLAKKELNIDNLTVINSRIEDFIENNREKFDYVVARAVAPLNTLIEYAIPYLKIGGKLIAYKGSNYEEELKEAEKALNTLKCELDEVFDYYIEEIDRTSYILTIQKLEKTDTKYPRKQNKPRLNPIK